MGEQFWIIAIGLIAQVFFSGRILIQWIMSQRAHKVLSPSLFWIFSVAGAYLLFIYGWLRNDFAIILGQFISYYVYLWNLWIKGIWKLTPRVVRWVLLLTPLCVMTYLASDAVQFVDKFFQNEDIPRWLIIFGSSGQVLFTLRFIYQWLYSRRAGESKLPAGFWIISLLGSMAIVTYGIIRLDAVLIIGQSVGLVAYISNLVILAREKKATVPN